MKLNEKKNLESRKKEKDSHQRIFVHFFSSFDKILGEN